MIDFNFVARLGSNDRSGGTWRLALFVAVAMAACGRRQSSMASAAPGAPGVASVGMPGAPLVAMPLGLAPTNPGSQQPPGAGSLTPPDYPEGLPLLPGSVDLGARSGSHSFGYVMPAGALRRSFLALLPPAGWSTFDRFGSSIYVCRGATTVGLSFQSGPRGISRVSVTSQWARPLPATGCPPVTAAR